VALSYSAPDMFSMTRHFT